MTALFLFVFSLLGTIGCVRIALGWLRARQVMDRPNERSSHTVPVPRGGGLGILPPLAAGLGWVAWTLEPNLLLPIAGALGLAAISFLDDLQPLPPGPRLLAQFFGAGLVIAALPSEPFLPIHGAPWYFIERGIALLALIWFINLTNFMDGIDGITGVEMASLGLGGALIALMLGLQPGSTLPSAGLILAGAALGFLVWNWHPAKLFMGDVGSIPLGLLSGWLLYELALAGALAAAITLPLVYAVDATATIIRRARKGEKIWEAHRTHAYQRATRNGLTHSGVSLRIAAANCVLIALAAATVGQPAVVQTVIVVAALLSTMVFLHRLAKGRQG